MNDSSSLLPPAAVDVRALAKQPDALAGRAPLTAFQRVVADVPATEVAGHLSWRVQAEWRAPLPLALGGESQAAVAGRPQLWMHVQLEGEVPQTCQRCLSVFAQPLAVDRWFRFVADEATAEAEDDDAEEDLLVLEPRFNLFDLLEDEVLLALPLVPMHDECPTPVRMSAGEEALAQAGADEKPHPFAALAALKRPSGDGGGER